jgi:tRNA pseudouridine32 synthase/23S rRNA pseudouridine746 synthase
MRQGVSPSCVVLPDTGPTTVLDFLGQRFPGISGSEWLARVDAGDVIEESGQPVHASTQFRAGLRLYYYRSWPDEAPIPFQEVVVYQDADLIVVDKPHFLPVMPSGKYVQETVLVRLKNQLGLDGISPIHRIDRDTAGLVLFSVNPATRNAYQALFRDRKVHKTYHAVAPWNPDLLWPVRRESRIGVSGHFMQQTEVVGPPNALTHIRPLENDGRFGLYELKPVTGHRHQLRVHMAALGIPIVNDGIYPTLTPEGTSSVEKPLQLLAKAISFTDPLTGVKRAFTSERTLRLPSVPIRP